MVKKNAYFQGGGGVNEPTPGQKKYKSDPAILVQPRFKEPFYRNYDFYDTEGVDGPPVHGPGSGWNHMNEYKSVQEFLDHRRQRLKGKYVADDFWIEDTEANRKQRVEKMKIRASLLSRVMETITDAPHNSSGSLFVNAQYMLPPKEHGTSIYDAKNSLYQGTPKAPNKHKADDNAIDFDIDDQIKSGPIEGEEGSYPASAQIGGYLDKYLPQNDFEGKSPDELDFGRDYTEDDGQPKSNNFENIEKLMTKYLNSKETDLYGLPDGVDPPEDLDPSATVNEPNPEYGETESGNTSYEDKWNI